MKTRYKISITAIVSLTIISFFVPEVFLIFYLDKFESNDNCNAIGGNWDWINDICELDGIENSDQMCMDAGGVPSCKVHCPRPFGIFTPWQLLPIFGCTQPCYPACDFDTLLEKVLEHDAYVAFKERFPDAKERYDSNAYGFSVSVWKINVQTNNELYVHIEYNEVVDRINVNVFCTSGVTNEHIKTEIDDNLAVDFIQTTGCLDIADP